MTASRASLRPTSWALLVFLTTTIVLRSCNPAPPDEDLSHLPPPVWGDHIPWDRPNPKGPPK